MELLGTFHLILIGKGTNLIIDLLSLHVSFSQFRSRDFLNSPSINYASKCTWIGRHLNKTVSEKPKLIQKLSCSDSVPVVLEVDSRKFQYKVLENRREK